MTINDKYPQLFAGFFSHMETLTELNMHIMERYETKQYNKLLFETFS